MNRISKICFQLFVFISFFGGYYTSVIISKRDNNNELTASHITNDPKTADLFDDNLYDNLPNTITTEQRITLCKSHLPAFNYEKLTPNDLDELSSSSSASNPCRVDCVVYVQSDSGNRPTRTIYTKYFDDGKTKCNPGRVCTPQDNVGVCKIDPDFLISIPTTPPTSSTTTPSPTTPSPTSPTTPTTPPPTTPTTPTTPPPTTPTTPPPTTPTTPPPTTPTTPPPTTPTTPPPTTPTTPSTTTPTTPSTTTPTTPSPTIPTTASPTTPTTTPTTTSKTITTTIMTQDSDCKKEGYFRDPKDPNCRKFFRCIIVGNTLWKVNYPECVKGLVFEEKDSVCQFSFQATQPCPTASNNQ